MNPLLVIDLLSVILAFVVFYLVQRTQKRFGRLVRPAFVIFYAVGILIVANAILEIGEYIVVEPTQSNTTLHVVIFAILVLITLGLVKIGYQLPLKKK